MSKHTIDDRRDREMSMLEIEKRQSMYRSMEKILRIYSYLGILLAVFGFAYFLVTTLDIHITKELQTALLVSGTGLTLAFTSRALIASRKKRINEEISQAKAQYKMSEFIRKWSEFEELGKLRLLYMKSDYNKHSIRDIIGKLYDNDIINTDDVLFLEEAIQARNMAVHKGSLLPTSVLDRLSAQLADIIAKVQQGQNLEMRNN